MSYFNLTEHEIHIVKDGEVVLTISPVGIVADAEISSELVDVVDGVELRQMTCGDVIFRAGGRGGAAVDAPNFGADAILIASRTGAEALSRAGYKAVCPGQLVKRDGRLLGVEYLSLI